MSLVPSGCITVREALDRVGQEHFGPQWTGKEHKARANIYSLEEWKRLRGQSADLSGRARRISKEPIIFGSGGGGGPSDNAEFASLQVERDAYERLETARLLLWRKLEAREWKAVVVNSSTGFKRPLSDDIWRTSNAKIYIEQGRAPVSRSSGWGDLFIVDPDTAKAKPDVEPRVVDEETHVSTPAAAAASNPSGGSGSPGPSAPIGTMEGLQQTTAAWDNIETTVSALDVPGVGRDALGQLVVDNLVSLFSGKGPPEPGMSGGPVATPEPAPQKSRKTNTGGAPGKWDWEGAFAEMARIVAIEEGFFDRATLNEYVKEWFMEHTGDCPVDSQVREKVKKFHETLWPPRT